MRPRGPAANDPEEVAFLLGCGSRERATVILTAVTDQCRNRPDNVAHCWAADIDRCVSFWRDHKLFDEIIISSCI